MNVSIGLRSDAGLRENNEDAVVAFRPDHIAAEAVLIVADGMGGRAMGERASRLAVTVVKNNLEKLLVAEGAKLPIYEEVLATAIRRANSRVYEAAGETPDNKGMGTTCVAAVIAGGRAIVAHVGDSRAYLLRDGMLRRLTDDHSYIQDQVRSGHLSDHDARNSQFKHVITRAIGIEATIKPEIKTHILQDGDTILLCTDGLSNVVDEAGMIQIITRTPRIQDACDYLVDAAKMGGSKDNITGALARIGGPAEPDPPMPPLMSEDATTKPAKEPASPEKAPKPRHRSHDTGAASNGSQVSPAERVDDTGNILVVAATVPATTTARSRMRLMEVVAAAAVAAAISGVCGYLIGQRSEVHPRVDVRRQAIVTAPPPATATVPSAYAAPQVLLAYRVLPSLMTADDRGVLVVNEDTKAALVINAIGQVRTLGTLTHTSFTDTAVGHAMATGPDGRIYVIDNDADDVVRYDSTGNFEITIAKGLLSAPQNIAVTRDNSIYIIDDDHLKVIRGLPATKR